MVELYPDEIKNIDEYEEVFGKLRLMESEESNMEIVLKYRKDDFDDEEYIEVCGKKLNPIVADEINETYALDCTKWAEWLGMEINKMTLKKCSEFEIICHCLYEMTFISFDEEIIQQELKELEEQITEIENMTEEERKEKLIPWEEVRKKLKGKE